MAECPHPQDFIKISRNADGSIDYECDICGDVIGNDPPTWVDMIGPDNTAAGHEHWGDS